MMPRARCVPVAAALAAAVALAGLAGCAAPRGAPVVDRSPQAKAPPTAPSARPVAGYYTVSKGDTLYSIALDHGVDYRELAQWNGITDPTMIRVGQQLRVTAPGSPATASALIVVSSSRFAGKSAGSRKVLMPSSPATGVTS